MLLRQLSSGEEALSARETFYLNYGSSKQLLPQGSRGFTMGIQQNCLHVDVLSLAELIKHPGLHLAPAAAKAMCHRFLLSTS